jgi:hypothetical protein
MKMFDRVTPHSAASWLGLTLAACGGAAVPDSASPAADGGKTTVTSPNRGTQAGGEAGHTAALAGRSGRVELAGRGAAAGGGAAPVDPAAAGSSGAGAAGAGAASAAGASAAAGAAADSGGAGASTAAGSGDAGASADPTRPVATTLMLPVTKESGGVAPWFDIYRPTDLDAVGGLLPVVVWANGGCVRSEGGNWQPLFDRWAAAGIITLALTTSPDGGLFDMTTDVEHKALIDWAVAEAAKDGSPYAGKLDLERIVTAGNSCGGVTALQVAAKDERVSAVFILSGGSGLGFSDPEVIGKVKVPVAYVNGSLEDDIAAPNALMDYDALQDSPAMIVFRAMADHPTVSTDPTIMKEAAEMSLNFLDLALFGTPEAAAALQAPNVCSICKMGEWELRSKKLDTLQR